MPTKRMFPDTYHESKWLRYESDIKRYYAQQIFDWQDNPKRNHSQTAFTEGLGRFIASMCERYHDIKSKEEGQF